MPNMNGTGPQGQGAMTGRGLGPCGGGMRRGGGRGLGRGLRRGLGHGRQATLTKDEEKKILEAELKEIELEKQEIEKRLKELK
jgi:hypothetical protein